MEKDRTVYNGTTNSHQKPILAPASISGHYKSGYYPQQWEDLEGSTH